MTDVATKNHGRKTHGLTSTHDYYSFYEDGRHVPALQRCGGTHAGSIGTRTWTSQPLLDPRKRLQPDRARRNGDLGMKTVKALTVP